MIKTDNKLIDQFLKSHADQVIGLVEDYDDAEIAMLLASLPPHIAATIMGRVVSFKAIKVVSHLDKKVSADIFSAMPVKKAGNLLLRCDKSLREEIMTLLSDDLKESIEYRLHFPKDAVGAHMDTNVLTFKSSYKISDCLALVKKHLDAVGSEIYVLSEQDELVGYVEVKDLLTDQFDRHIRSIIQEKPMTFLPAMSVEDLLVQWESKFIQLPVVDADGIFLGVISKLAILELVGKDDVQRKPIFKAGSALSELYRIGFISLLGTSPESNLKKGLS